MKFSLSLITAVTSLFLVAGAASAFEPVGSGPVASGPADNSGFTAAWEGIWSITTVDRDCDTGLIVNTSTEQDSICAGATWIADSDSSISLVCTNTIDDTNLSGTCGGSSVPIDGCTLTFNYTVSATRNGDSFTGTATRSFVSSGTCAGAFDQCVNQEITGTRISSATPNCTTPVLPSTWGLLKSRYATG